MFLEKREMEELLCTLDENGSIFPGFEIVKVNNRPNLLGTGGFSSVYEMCCLKRPEKGYVLKVIGFDKHVVTSESFWETIRVQGLLTEQSEYICRVISAKEINVTLDDEGHLVEVTEAKEERWNEEGIHIQFILMERLEEIINKDKFGKVTLYDECLSKEEEVIDFALQIGNALYCAHSKNILHRDIKLENIFWDNEELCYKLGDFGLAKQTVEGSADTVVYTDGYGAPEIEKYLSESYNATADIYSFGITLYLLLNNLRFPGSEGYYVNIVQYNPEFVFPAPANASEGMVRIIRKMCQYDKEERYQSVKDVLMDLAALKAALNASEDNETEDNIELPDFATETYRDDKVKKIGIDEAASGNKEMGRAERKEYKRIEKSMFIKTSMGYFAIFTFLLTIVIGGYQGDSAVVQNWKYWILPAMVAVEAVLLIVKEFNISFAIISMIVGIYLGITIGFTASYVIMLVCLVLGAPAISGASAVATVLWVLLSKNVELPWIEFIRETKISWIIIFLLAILIYEYLIECAVYGVDIDETIDGEETDEIIGEEEEQMYDNQMDDRGNGEHSDPIE